MSDSEVPVIVRHHPADNGMIQEIQLHRPQVHNAVDGASAQILLRAWQEFRDDDRLVVSILHGAGEQAFCAGADLSGLAGLAAHDAGSVHAGPMGGTRIIQTKPVITVSQGYTYAGGLELFCHGHIRLAEPKATFSVACRRWGVPLVDGGTVLLPRLLGWGAALPLIITGQRIDAARAHQLGLVWELVPQGGGLARAFEMARQICQMPRDALLADLRSAILGSHLGLDESFEFEAESLDRVLSGDSMQKGVEAFLAGKRFWFQ